MEESNARPPQALLRLSQRRGAWHKAGVTHELPPAPRWRRLLRPRWWLTALLLAACAWSVWREYDYRAAIREAKTAGFTWKTREPFDAIRGDWRAAFRKATWTDGHGIFILDQFPTSRATADCSTACVRRF